jgi:hypothetical protein
MRICFYMYADGICGRYEDQHTQTTHVHKFTAKVSPLLTSALLEQVAPDA